MITFHIFLQIKELITDLNNQELQNTDLDDDKLLLKNVRSSSILNFEEEDLNLDKELGYDEYNNEEEDTFANMRYNSGLEAIEEKPQKEEIDD